MEKKKRNIVLEILLCTGIIGAVLLAYLTFAADNGIFEIRGIEGEASALADFSFEGYAGDAVHQIRYRLENGTFTRKTYPCNPETICGLIDAEKKGINPLIKYLHGDGWGKTSEYSGEVASAPEGQTGRTPIQSWEDVPKSIMEQRFEQRFQRMAYYDEENPYGSSQYAVRGEIAEEAAFYAEVSQWNYTKASGYHVGLGEKSARAFTGLRLTDGPYYYLQWKPKEDDSRIYSDELGYGGKNFEFLITEAGGDAYGILATKHNAKGEVFLLHFPNEKMLPMSKTPRTPSWPDGFETSFHSTTYGGAETIAVFDVDEESSIFALTAIGSDRLLLVRTEMGQLYLELYDTQGTQIAREPMGLENATLAESLWLGGLHREDSAILAIDFSFLISAGNGEDTLDSYEGVKSDRYLVTREGILRLDGTADADYVDHKNGRTLIVNTAAENNTLALQYTHRIKYTQLSLTVKDEETEETLYKGVLATDFAEDYNKELASVNLVSHAETLEQQRMAEEMDVPQWQVRFRYMNRDIRPLDGTADSEQVWRAADSYVWNEYYDEGKE